jgi:hypothetical protein
MCRIERVTASLKRCLMSPAFLERFLVLLSERAPQVRACIETHHGGPLKIMARRCVTTVVLAVAGAVPPAEARLKFEDCRAAGGPGMTPERYPRWAEALILAAAEHDPLFGPDLEAEWRAVLAEGAAFLPLCGQVAPAGVPLPVAALR